MVRCQRFYVTKTLFLVLLSDVGTLGAMTDFAEYETVALCTMCNHERHRSLFGRRHIERCATCGHLFLGRRPTQRAIAASYDDEDGTHSVWKSERPGREIMWAKRAARIAHLVPGGGRALDVGTGFGDFLRHLRSVGDWEVEGTEVSQNAVAHAHETHGLEVHVGQVEDCSLPEDRFDLITMWHVLEHVPQPGATLDLLATLLRPGGVLVVAVPNDGVWPRLLFLALRDITKWPVVKLLGRPYRKGVDAFFGPPVFGTEIHLSFFEPRRLGRAMEARGLETIEVGVDDLYARPRLKTTVAHALFDFLNRTTGTNFSRATLVVAQKSAEQI